MKRRRVLQGIGTVAVAAGALTAWRFAPPPSSSVLRSPAVIASELLDSVDDDLRAQLQVDYDHPYRQYHNRGVWGGGVLAATAGFSWHQRSLVVDLMHAGLSEAGRKIIPRQMVLTLPDALANNLLICGEPGSPNCQILFTGAHLNLRIGGASREGAAFGGPQVYGDQWSDEVPGLPRNMYRPQFQAGMALFDALSPQQQREAVVATSPIQTRIEVQGRHGKFAGTPVRDMAPGQSALVSKMIDLTLMPYPAADVAYAWQCIEANGGLDAMHASFYADSRYNNEGGYQTYRLEGPASVFYFRGFPHVHAFFNVAMDADAPLSVGRVVGRNPKHIEGERLTELFEQAMQQHNGVDFAWYPGESAVGVLREGAVRTGDVYTAESWENRVTVLELTGGEFSTQMADTLQARGAVIDPARRYRIATVDYVVSAMLESAIGQATVVGDGGLLRDQTIAHIEAHGFA